MKKKYSQSELLLSLSDAIVRIRSKQDMLDIILHQLKKYIQFDDSFILRYNKEKRTCWPYIYHSKKNRTKNPEYKPSLDLEYHVADDSVEETNYPQVYKVDTLLALGTDQINFMHSSGIKEFAVIKLIEGSQLRGLLILLSEQANSFQPEDLDLLHRISYQISTATANIVANEEIAKREEEKEILLSLSQEISVVRSKNDLRSVLREKLKELFPVTGFGITLVNEDGHTHSPFIIDTEKAIKKNAGFEAVAHKSYSVRDPVFTQILNSSDPLILVVDNIAAHRDAPEYVLFWKKVGIDKVLGMPLRVGQNNIGCLIFHLPHPYKNNISTNLLKGVCAQISVRLSTIIAYEEIAKREEEKTILLSLSNEIAFLKDRNDLYRIVNTRIKKLFSIKQFGIAQVNEDGVTHSAFMMDLGDPIHNHNDFAKVVTAKYSISDTAYSSIAASDDPVILDVLQLAREPDPPAYVRFWLDVGFRELFCLALRVGGKDIGCIFFNIDANKINNLRTNLLKGVCAQLSVAVSNILATEKIKKADEEKSLLLSFSKDIATARDKKGLRLVIKQYLKNIFHIREYIITTRNIDNETYSHFLHDANADDPTDEGWKIMTSNRIPVKGAITGAVLQSEEPVTFVIEDILRDGKPYFPAASFWKAAGAKELMGLRLKVADRDVGLLLLQPGQVNTQLLKGISAQLAIAIANVVANEEIVGRENERELLLSLNLDIAGVRNTQELLTVINQKLKILLGFSHTVIAMMNDDKTTARVVLLDPESKSKNHPDYMQKKSYPIEDGVLPEVLTSRLPFVYDLTNWNKTSEGPLYFKINSEVGMEQAVMVRFSKGDAVLGVWIIIYAKKIALEKSSLALIEGLANQMSIALSNIIANNEIQGKEAEKSRLLSFSNAMASSGNKAMMGKILTQQLKEVLNTKGHYMVYALSSDKKTYYPIMFDPDSSLSSLTKDPGFETMVRSDNLVSESIVKKILQADKPIIFNVEERFNKPMTPAYEKMMKERGIIKITGAPIKLGNEAIGVILFDTNNAPLGIQEPLFKGICSQIAVAVSNIIADEEIQEREKEKSMLLEFSNAIASVRDKASLAKILNRQLKELLGIQEYAIHILSEDKKTHRPVFYDPEAAFARHPAFQSMINQQTDVNDGIFNNILASPDPVTFDAEKWVTLNNPPVYADAAIDIGLKKLTGVRIHLGEENIAVLNFRHDAVSIGSNKYPLLNSICSQIAIAIANIMANEKILNQLNEINTYKQQLEEEKVYLKEEIETTQNFSELIGESAEMKKVFRLVQQVSASDSTVLLLGETGTGKELIARAIHNGSPRKNKLMVKVNCAAIPPNLIESELFGHERGSFTGATERRIGKFELADHGTLFLDEIGEMPLEMQVKLLRALQEKEIERVGGKITIRIDVRIIAATNRDLEKFMEEGKFRSDLYYRLNIFPINLPALKNRREDIPALAQHFVKRFAKKAGKQVHSFSNKAMQELMQYNWPGNIRELEHLIERSILLTEGDTIKEIHLPATKQNKTILPEEVEKIKTIDENERMHILKTLKFCRGRVAGEGGAAELLGVPPSTLNSKMKKLGIRKEHFG